MVEVMKIMVTSFKRSHACTQCLRPCSKPPPTHASAGDSWTLMGKSGSVSLWGRCSFLLGPVMHKVLFVPFENLFPQSYVRLGISVVGLIVTSSMRAHAIPRDDAPSPCPCGRILLTQTSTGDFQT